MNLELRRSLVNQIQSYKKWKSVIDSIDIDSSGIGTITYNPKGVFVDPKAIGFAGTTTDITDEELVRASLLVKLVEVYGYKSSCNVLEIERVYKSVGRPGKGGRVDILVRRVAEVGIQGEAFLFIECKAPDKFDSDLNMIDGQLFRLSRQESVTPRNLVYFTTEYKGGALLDRVILIDTKTFPDYEEWDKAGQPIVDTIPAKYGAASKRRYANVTSESKLKRPLDNAATSDTFHRIKNEIHDVIWGGGGTNNNEVFVYITKLILCKIYDEQETGPNFEYSFQRLGDAVTPESPDELTERLNVFYREAESAYLALPKASAGPAFDTTRISAQKIAYVVGRLEGISVTTNIHHGDLLGEFFEQIVSQDFTQTKGQFFTPPKIVRFMLRLLNTAERSKDVMLKQKDHLGRPRMPYVIDPSCGSGTFLIEYMKEITQELGTVDFANTLPVRLRGYHDIWFGGNRKNHWAKDFLFGIENNYDLGLAAKVNMVLHGDGSMNTWIASGLLPYRNYWVETRHNLLGIPQQTDAQHPYKCERNEQFDFIITNPPFSVKMSPDEQKEVEKAFSGTIKISETLFIERWYQLLREGGLFCSVLPESVLDTSTNKVARLFMLKHFRIKAIISLPYDAFKPFTSTKTCIVLAEKKSKLEIAQWDKAIGTARRKNKGLDEKTILLDVVKALSLDDDVIFMAEPQQVGYKRRKGLADLQLPNDLYLEDGNGHIAYIDKDNPQTVLDLFYAGVVNEPSSTLGFNTNISSILSREGYRLDPKYRWFWQYQGGVAHGSRAKAVQLSDLFELVEATKFVKGDLQDETPLIDLESVESKQALLSNNLPLVDVIGSDKICFSGMDIAISKLEPYLAKVIISPPTNALGSTEWVGLRVKLDIPFVVLAYLLMLPSMCDAYRRLQSGKRHARFDPAEFLQIKAELPDYKDLDRLASDIEERRNEIIRLRDEQQRVRNAIDNVFDV